MRVQIYPSQALQTKLAADAAQLNISMSALVVDILEQYYQISPQLPPFTQLVKIICEEIKEYVNTNYSGEFSISDASATCRSIPMTIQNRPNPMRMRLGHAINKQVTEGCLNGIIEQVFIDGKPKRSAGNKAALFVKIVGEVE